MARGKGRGGYQAPSKPAPVSGPGALSARTDGGPSQPIRPVPGGTYGDRQATVQQQQAAPLAATQPAQGGALPNAPVADRRIDPFGPTARPDEPVTAGAAPLAPSPPAQFTVLERLRALYAVFPTDDLREVIEDAERGEF